MPFSIGYQNNCEMALATQHAEIIPGLQPPVGVGGVGHSRLGGDVFGVLRGRLDLANDVIAEVAGGALCPEGHCVLVYCEKEKAIRCDASGCSLGFVDINIKVAF